MIIQTLDSKRRKITATRLLQALKAKLPGTDLQRKAQEFADKQHLELDNVIDAERTAPRFRNDTKRNVWIQSISWRQ